MTLSPVYPCPSSYKNSYNGALINVAPPYNADDRARSLAIPQLKDWEELLLSSDKVVKPISRTSRQGILH